SKTLAASVVTAGVVALAIALAAVTTWIGGELLGQGADFSSMEGVMTTQLATLGSYLLISLAMGLLTQSSVLGLLSAIGIPFLTATAVPLATLTGSELFIDVVRAVDLPGAAVALGDGRAGAFELLPLALPVLLPAARGVWRWNRREVGCATRGAGPALGWPGSVLGGPPSRPGPAIALPEAQRHRPRG